MYSGKKAQHDFPKMRGGGSKAVWNFSKNSSVLEEPPFPYPQRVTDTEGLELLVVTNTIPQVSHTIMATLQYEDY